MVHFQPARVILSSIPQCVLSCTSQSILSNIVQIALNGTLRASLTIVPNVLSDILMFAAKKISENMLQSASQCAYLYDTNCT